MGRDPAPSPLKDLLIELWMCHHANACFARKLIILHTQQFLKKKNNWLKKKQQHKNN